MVADRISSGALLASCVEGFALVLTAMFHDDFPLLIAFLYDVSSFSMSILCSLKLPNTMETVLVYHGDRSSGVRVRFADERDCTAISFGAPINKMMLESSRIIFDVRAGSHVHAGNGDGN